MIRVRVPAKINLSLCVGAQRDDGYHDIVTVFHGVDLTDELILTATDSRISLTMTGPGTDSLPTDERNLAVRAALLLRERFGTPQMGAQLRIRKQIPIAGGMAGGSANAAAVLLGCARAWALDTRTSELHQLAAELGSDVPFALSGGTMLGRGRGHLVEALPHGGRLHWALALAHQGLSTPDVFRRFDQLGGGAHPPATTQFFGALASADVARVAVGLHNDLQAAALDLMPQLAGTLAAGEQLGALASLVSGSGPTCAFLCPDHAAAQRVAAGLAKLPQVGGVHVASGPVKTAVVVD